MKKQIFYHFLVASFTLMLFQMNGQSQNMEIIRTNPEGQGHKIALTVIAGPAHNHPMMAAWIEDMDGNFLQTIYVNESVAKGYYAYAKKDHGKWQPGEAVRPASLPVWAHSRGLQSKEGHFMPTIQNPVPDAYTAATPEADFAVYSKTQKSGLEKVKIFFEINQSWDWNEFWTNSKYPEDPEYKTSSQPSVVYATTLNFKNKGEVVHLHPIGHGHHSGKDGTINPDLSTLTTALKIVDTVMVEIE
jgi:hypothetical protein